MKTRSFASALIFTLASVAASPAQDIKMFGHDVEIRSPLDGGLYDHSLFLNGKKQFENDYIYLTELVLINGIPVLIGHSAINGNACDAQPFVISFPERTNPRVDGPLELCHSVNYELVDNTIVFTTKATPGSPGERVVWTFEDGLTEHQGEQFMPDASKGWTELRERDVTHPSGLFEYAEIASELGKMAGDDKDLVLRIFSGVGSVKFKGDFLVAQSCTPHNCTVEEALVVADIRKKQLYLAWKPEGQKIKVRPEIASWPEGPRSEIRGWASKWK